MGGKSSDVGEPYAVIPVASGGAALLCHGGVKVCKMDRGAIVHQGNHIYFGLGKHFLAIIGGDATAHAKEGKGGEKDKAGDKTHDWGFVWVSVLIWID